jgi:hypothetical protein
MSGRRILVACELQSYRQALAAAFREVRSEVEVFEAEKYDLNRELVRLRPADLVVCSRLTALVEDQVASWVELYSYHGSPRWSACWVKAQPSRRYNSPTCSP